MRKNGLIAAVIVLASIARAGPAIFHFVDPMVPWAWGTGRSAYYEFDEKVGYVQDGWTNDLDALIVGAPTWGTNRPAGFDGGTYDLNGTDQYLQISAAQAGGAANRAFLTNNIKPNFTIACWARRDTADLGVAFGLDAAGAQSAGYGIWLDAGRDTILPILYTAGGDNTARTSGLVATNQWYHYVATYDGSTTYGYTNTHQAHTASGPEGAITYDSAGNNYVRIGDVSTFFLDGGVYEVCLYNRVITSAERTNLYTDVDVTTGLVAQWRMTNDVPLFTVNDIDPGRADGDVGEGGSTEPLHRSEGTTNFYLFGGDDKITVSNTTDGVTTTNFTILCWIRYEDSDGKLFNDTDNDPYFQAVNGKVGWYSGAVSYTGVTVNVSDGGWHHVAIAANGASGLKLYADGEIELSTNAVSALLDQHTWDIGITYGGTIDQFAIVPETYTDARIYDIFNGTRH